MRRRLINKIWNIVTTIILVIMVLLLAVMFVPKFFGIEPMIVLSGSMEPTYHVGALLYVDKDTSDIEVGDTITFYSDKEKQILVTHRVVEIDYTQMIYYTQGDANLVRDINPVSKGDILGTPLFSIPNLGYLADKLSYTSGKIIYIICIVFVTILLFWGDYLWSSDKKKDS